MAKARVLAVDDQRYFRELIAGLLTEEGYEAETASSGEEALQILGRSDFDVVLTDLVMPGMDGSELVHRVKQRNPDQDVVVVTGVVDVATAVEAMKLGASDYLLKPFDRRALAVTLEDLLLRRRIKAERDRLLAENIEYIAETRLRDRALDLFAALDVEPLAERMLRALCVETGAQGAVLWVASENAPGRLDLAAAHGLVRLADEPESIEPSDLPPALAGEERAVFAAWGDGARQPALYLALRRDATLLGLARLTDKLEGERFEEIDRMAGERLARHAELALANALRLRALERRSFEDLDTGVWRHAFLVDVARGEIEKANRFGRSLALLAIEPGWPTAGRPPAEASAAVARSLAGVLRATDLLAVDPQGRFHALLAECDALGAAVFKRRCLEALERCEALSPAAGRVRGKAAERPRSEPQASEGGPPHGPGPRSRIASASYPGDGTQLEALERTIEARLEAGRRSIVASLGLERLSLSEAMRALLREGTSARAETAGQIVRFALGEIGRRPRERCLVYVAPGAALADPVHEALESLRGVRTRTDLIVLGGEPPPEDAPSVAWVAADQIPDLAPCLVYYGDGAAYALVRAPGPASGPTRLFHASDRELVEYLALRLQQELALPRTLEEAA
jgi:DNA-binding response OmpR family regulator